MGRALILDGSAAELVGGVERRDLVALRQRRVVEDRLEEVVDPAPQGQHRLADMDQLRRAAPDDVDAEESPILPVEEHLEEAAIVAQDLPAGDLSVPGHAGLVGHLALGQLVLGGADHRDRKSTRLNSSHGYISYAVFCLKKKKKTWTETVANAS